jgi:hypothetical protein
LLLVFAEPERGGERERGGRQGVDEEGAKKERRKDEEDES